MHQISTILKLNGAIHLGHGAQGVRRGTGGGGGPEGGGAAGAASVGRRCDAVSFLDLSTTLSLTLSLSFLDLLTVFP